MPLTVSLAGSDGFLPVSVWVAVITSSFFKGLSFGTVTSQSPLVSTLPFNSVPSGSFTTISEPDIPLPFIVSSPS